MRSIEFSHACWHQLQGHLATVGEDRYGVLLGRQSEHVLRVSGVMSGGYPPYVPRGLMAIDASYVLGLVDGARLTDAMIDWVGVWAMAASGESVSPAMQYEVMVQARQAGVFGPDLPLVFIGRGAAQFNLTAWTGDAEGNQELAVTFESVS